MIHPPKQIEEGVFHIPMMKIMPALWNIKRSAELSLEYVNIPLQSCN